MFLKNHLEKICSLTSRLCYFAILHHCTTVHLIHYFTILIENNLNFVIEIKREDWKRYAEIYLPNRVTILVKIGDLSCVHKQDLTLLEWCVCIYIFIYIYIYRQSSVKSNKQTSSSFIWKTATVNLAIEIVNKIFIAMIRIICLHLLVA